MNALALKAAGRLAAALAVMSGAAAWAENSASLAEGQAAYDRGDLAAARRAWEPLANAGDADAAFDLGVLSDLGASGASDTVAAWRWYRLAASHGHVAAAFNVAVMLDSGRGVTRDLAAAATWYAEAAARGHGRAAFNLAQLCEAGTGVPRNSVLARAWLRVAAKAGLTAADRPSPPPVPGDTPTALAAPEPTTPAGDVAAGGKPVGIVAVWRSPPQPARTRFFVQVLEIGAQPAQVFAGYSDVSALLLPLPATPARYAWRVYATDPAGHYAPSPWQAFSVAPGSGSHS